MARSRRAKTSHPRDTCTRGLQDLATIAKTPGKSTESASSEKARKKPEYDKLATTRKHMMKSVGSWEVRQAGWRADPPEHVEPRRRPSPPSNDKPKITSKRDTMTGHRETWPADRAGTTHRKALPGQAAQRGKLVTLGTLSDMKNAAPKQATRTAVLPESSSN